MTVMPRILGVRANGVVRVDNTDYGAFRVGIYQPIARKADGVKTMRLVGNVGPHFKERRDAIEFGELYCEEHENEYFFFANVKQGYLFDNLPDGVHTYFDFMEAME